MFKFLREILICPACHKELVWNVLEESDLKILNANIECSSCGNKYSVKDGIGSFLVEDVKELNLWEIRESYLDKLFKENIELKEKLMSATLEEMTAADMYIKGDVLMSMGLHKEANELYDIAFKNAYTQESLTATDSQIKYLISLLKNEEGFIVDLASGPCTLVKEILYNTELKVVATDISMNIAKKTYESLVNKGYDDQLTYLVFDSRKSPFRTNTIPILTSFYGLQNIEEPGNILSELSRISSGELYSVCSLCSEDDEANLGILQKFGLEEMYLKKEYKKQFSNNGFSVEILNPIFAKTSPTPRDKIIKHAIIDGFPVAEAIFEHCIIKGS